LGPRLVFANFVISLLIEKVWNFRLLRVELNRWLGVVQVGIDSLPGIRSGGLCEPARWFSSRLCSKQANTVHNL